MENNEMNNESVGLLKRVYTKFKSSKVAQKLTALAITAATVLTLSACDETSTTPDDDVTINDTNQNNQNNQTNVNKNPIDVSGYSQILQNILLDKYYDNLINQTTVGKNYELLETGVFEPHPYAFLESEGFDVEAIKNDEIEAYTMSCVLDEDPNNLYIYTRVMQDNSYWHNYLLKYELTDQEMNDYHFLHTGQGRTEYFIQSVFMNNEIAKTREPEIIGQSKMSIGAFERMTEDLQRVKLFDTNNLDVIFLNPNKDDLTFDLFLIPRYNDEFKMCFENKFVYAKCLADTFFMENEIYDGPTEYDWLYRVTERSESNVTYYFSQDANMDYFLCKSLEDTNPQY